MFLGLDVLLCFHKDSVAWKSVYGQIRGEHEEIKIKKTIDVLLCNPIIINFPYNMQQYYKTNRFSLTNIFFL